MVLIYSDKLKARPRAIVEQVSDSRRASQFSGAAPVNAVLPPTLLALLRGNRIRTKGTYRVRVRRNCV